MVDIQVSVLNSNDGHISVQVDPWAGLYLLKKGDRIDLVATSNSLSPRFSIEESKDTRILTFWDCSEYFILKDGRRVHWTKFPNNLGEGAS
jgi:hypothetical protein